VVKGHPKLTSDFNASITICDPTRSLIGTGLLCFFYRENADDLPQPLATGEILIAYDMKIRPHNLDIQAWSTHTTRFKLVSPGFDIRALKSDEHVMVKEMREWWNARGGAPGAKGEVVKRDKEGGIVNEDGVYTSKKMKRISEMEVNTFSDLVCEVSPSPLYLCTSLPTSVPARSSFSFYLFRLSIFVSSLVQLLTYQVVKTYPGSPYTLYVTDYTQNTSLYSYQWSAGHNDWKGPYGKYTLQLACWDNVATTAAMCKVGGHYLIKNVRAKR